MSSEELAAYVKIWTKNHSLNSLMSIEDPFDEEDWDGFRHFTAAIGGAVFVTGIAGYIDDKRREFLTL